MATNTRLISHLMEKIKRDEMETYNSNEMMSLGEAETFEGENVSSPLAPPTTTLITFGTAEDGVGSGEPGYDE